MSGSLRVIVKIATRTLGISIFCILLSNCTFKSKHEPPNTLHLVAEAKIKGLDPIYAEDRYSAIQSRQAYDTLLQYHYLKRPYVLVPSLLESMPEVAKGSKVYRFKLKKGILFQDDPSFKETHGKGREMTAEDVIYSFLRLADPKLVSPGWWIFDGKIEGLNAWRDLALKDQKADYAKPIEGLKATGRYTFEIKLTQPSSQFLYSLAMPFTGIVPREATEFYGREFINHAVGSGPFKLAEYSPTSKIIWKRNPTYRNEDYPSEGAAGDQEQGLLQDAGKPVPFVEQMVFQVYIERQPMWLSFLSGRLDVAGIPKDNFQTIMTDDKELKPEFKEKGLHLRKAPALDVTHLTFNMNDPVVGKNKLLRQALSLAFDEKTLIELFYNGRAIPAQGPIPPGVSGYSPAFKSPFRQFNLEKAKLLLAKAGYPDGAGLEPLEYASLEGSDARQQAELIQRMMTALGVQLRINTYSWPQFLEVVKNRKAQMWGQAWAADYPDGENFLQLFYSKNASPGPNDSNYSNPDFDKLYEKALLLQDGPERTALYQKMVSLLAEDCPWIFIAHRVGYALVHQWLKNYKPNEIDHSYYKYLRIDSTLRK